MRALAKSARFAAAFALAAALPGGAARAEEAKAPEAPAAAPAAKDLKNPVAHTRASAARGKALYLRHCRACHDFDGKGLNGVDFVNTPLPDLTNIATFKHGATDGEMFVVIRDGTTTDMESFKAKMTEEEIWHTVNFLASIRAKPRPFVEPTPEPEAGKPAETTAAAAAPVDPKELKNPIETSPASIGRGKQIYLRNCRACHDFDGRGLNGVDFVNTPLPDLTAPEGWKHGTTEGEIFTVIKNGTKTDMEAFKGKLTDEEIWHTVNFVRSLAKKPAKPAGEGAGAAQQ